MYHTTGYTRDQITDLCAMVYQEVAAEGTLVWPPVLGLFKSVVMALTCMRRNRVQVDLAETFEVSQSTISRAITGVTPVLGTVLAGYVPTADELDEGTQYIVDGTLLPCWSWARPWGNATKFSFRRRGVDGWWVARRVWYRCRWPV